VLYQAKKNSISIIVTFLENVWFQKNIHSQTKKGYWKLKGEGKYEPKLEFPEGWEGISHQPSMGGLRIYCIF